MAACSSTVSLDMVESDMAGLEAVPPDVPFDSDSDDSAANSDIGASLGLRHDSTIKEIFKAAQQLSHQDRANDVDERRRCQKLMDFILAHGFSSQELNDFDNAGTVTRQVNAHDLFDKSSQRTGSDAPFAPSTAPRAGQLLASLSSDGVASPPNLACDEPVLEEGELPSSPETISPDKQSWSSIVAQGEPKSCLKLDYYPPLLLLLKMALLP